MGFAQRHQVFHRGSALPLRTRERRRERLLTQHRAAHRLPLRIRRPIPAHRRERLARCRGRPRNPNDTTGERPRGRAPVISLSRAHWPRRPRLGSNERRVSDRSRSSPRASARERRQISSYIRRTGLTPKMVLFFSAKRPSRSECRVWSQRILRPLRGAAWSSDSPELLKAFFELSADHFVHIHQ